MDTPLPDEISRWIDRAPERGRRVLVNESSDGWAANLIEMRRWPPWSPREHACLVAGAVGETVSEALQAVARHSRVTEEEARK